MIKVGGGEDQLSTTYWVNKATSKYPLIAAYAGLDTSLVLRSLLN